MRDEIAAQKKLKVFMVELHSPRNRYILELARQLRNYCDLTIYSKEENDFTLENVHWINGFYDGGKGKIGAILAYGRTLMQIYGLVTRGHYDILHIQSFKKADTEMKLYIHLKKYCKKLVMTVHNALPHEPSEGDLALYKHFYEACDLLIVHNDTTQKVLEDQFGIPREKIEVIPRGLYDTYETGARAEKKDGRFHFTCFGRIRPYKGVDILIRAIGLLTKEERQKCLFTIKGEQYPQLDKTDYRAMIRDLGIEDCVDFSPERVPEEQIPTLMGETDAMVFPYRVIYGSGVLLMAYTFGIPVIASDIPSFVEGTNNGESGLLFQSENPEALKDAILKALTWDEQQVVAYKKGIEKIVAERHSWKVTAQRTENALRRVLARP